MSVFYKYSKEVSLKQLQYEQAKPAPAVRICNNYLISFVQISSTLFYDVSICVVALQLNLNFIEIIYS